MKLKRKFLITGCGRSGTKYMAELLKQNGIKVEHEKDAEEGIVSWPMAAPRGRAVFGPSHEDYEFEKVVLLVRNPRDVIGSVMTFEEKNWIWIGCKLPEMRSEDSLLLKAARYWYHWNMHILGGCNTDFVLRVEDVDAEILRFVMEQLGCGTFDPTSLDRVPKNTNSREHARIDLRDIEKEDRVLFEKITELGRILKYTDEDMGL